MSPQCCSVRFVPSSQSAADDIDDNDAADDNTADEGFEPCRAEDCSRIGVHPVHDDSGYQLACPKCSSDLINLPKGRARCVRCDWRGDRKSAQIDIKRNA